MAKILPDDVDASLSFLEANPRAAKPLDKIPAAPIIRKDITQQKTGIPDDVEASLARLEGKPVPTFAQPTERGLTQREIEADVLGLAIRKGIKSDTALAAHRRDVAAKTGVNPGLVTSQVEDTAFYKEHDPEDLIKNFPAVAKYLGVQGNAELVGKDIGHLKTLETFFRRAVQDPEIVAAKGVVALAQSAVGIVDLNPFFLGALGKKLEEKGIDFPKISKTLTELYTPEMQAALGEVQNAKGFWGTLQAAAQNPSAVGEMVGVSLPSMYLGSIYARAMMPLLPAAAAIPIGEGLTMAGSAAEQIRTQSPDKELDAKGAWLSWGTGLAGTAVGAFGMKFSQRIGIEDPDVLLATGKLSDVVIGKMQQSKVPLSLATRLSAGFVSEGIVEELPQGVTEQVFQNIALGKQWDEGVPEAAALSIVTGGAMGAAVQAGVPARKQGASTDDPLHKATDAHLNDIGKAVSAEEQQAALQKWSEEVVNNKLRKESPSAFKEFIKTMADEHSGIKEVFIDAKHLEESLQQSGIKPEEFVKNMPEVARDLRTALATGGEVRISIEDYATYLAGSKLEPMILNELRTDPEGMTYSESQTFFQQQKEIFAEKAKEIITSSQPVPTREEFAAKPQNDGKDYTEYLKSHENKVEAFARDAQEVHDKILTGMNSAKRFNRAVNAVYAVPFREFYAVNAAKEGILPSELYARLPLNFSKMQIEDGGLEQDDVSTLSQQEVERRLVAQHNISVNNLVHADRMGGLAAPSLAITGKDNVFSSFGDITLLSSKDMVDPKSGAKVFGADIYSPRYPRVDYSFSKESITRLNEDLKDALTATNDTPFEAYALNGNQSDVERTLKENAAVLYSFLQDKKVKPKLVKTKKSVLPKWALKYADKQMYVYVDSPAYLKDIENAPEYAKVFDHVKDDSPEEKARMVRNLANSKAYTIDAYRTDKPNFGKIDPKGSLQEMTSQLYAKGLQQEYDAHLYSLALSLNPVEKIFKGFSPSGSSKYVPHNVENVIKEMKTELRGGESFNYGLGSVRSKFAPQFKSVEQIRKADNRLLSTDAFEEVKKEVEQEYMSLLEEVGQYYKHKSSTSFGFDSENAVLHDAAKLGIPRALRENQYENVPQETQERIRDFLSKLADMPTEYFEVKLLRRVGLNEFSGAVVPKNAGQQVIDILKKNGVKDIKFYKPQDNKDRLAKINEFSDLFFQSAFYSALEREIPKLYSKLEQALEAANDKIFSTGPQVKLWLQSNAGKLGIKKDEIYWSGIDNWLDAQGKVNKQQVVEFVRNNGVKVEDVTLGDKPSKDDLSKISKERYGIPFGQLSTSDQRDLMDELDASGAKHNNDKLTLPGGTDYKELVVTVPTIEKYNESDSTHFGDTGQGKQIGWLRMDTRDGGLFIEELQSQRAQQGRSKGFFDRSQSPYIIRRKEIQSQIDDVNIQHNMGKIGDITHDMLLNDLKTQLRALPDSDLKLVPPAPFVSDANNKATNAYITLLMKKALIEAVSNDHASVSWTTGDQQADRYDLSKQVRAVIATRTSEGEYQIEAIGSTNERLIEDTYSVEKLPELIGKDLAEKISKQAEGKVKYTGLDLKTGGEWAQSMYGNEQGLNAQGKPSLMSQAANDIFKHVGSGKVESINGQPGFYVTPEMKSKDLPLFQGNRAGFNPNTFTMTLLDGSDLSSVIHEGGHFYLEALNEMATRPEAPQQIKDDFRKTLEWFGITGNEVGIPGGPLLDQKAFHGSPHDHNKFDSSKIGTGEGAQAYGYGHYFTDTKEVAEHYRNVLANDDIYVATNGSTWSPDSLEHLGARVQARKLLKGSTDLTPVIAKLESMAGNVEGKTKDMLSRDIGVLQNIKDNGGLSKTGGKLYEVELAPEQDEYLLWDKPLSEQSDKVKAALGELPAGKVNPDGLDMGGAVIRDNRKGQVKPGSIYPWVLVSGDSKFDLTQKDVDRMLADNKEKSTGENIYSRVTSTKGSQRAASEYLHSLGIRGIKYLDGTSRGTGEGSYNYVIFSDEDITITDKYYQGGETPQPGQLPPGRTPEEIWNSMTLDQKRPYHEQWAQSWERYALEGKAPTLEMQPVFARFRAWMLNIYRSMKEFLRNNPLAGKLNDDIRAVFDRLIASDEAISEAQKARSYAPLFATSEEAGVTDKQFQEYVDEGRRSADEATSELDARSIRDMKWLTGARTKALKSLQAEARTKRKMMRTEVEQDIAQEPVERAKSYFAKGEYVNDNGEVIEAEVKAKLNKAEVRGLMPNIDMQKLRGMTADDGIALNLAAQLTGFGSGEALLKALNDSEPTRDKVAAEVDKRMLEQYGDLVDDAALSAAADEAVHNEARARFMATGLKMLLKTSATSSQLVKAAKQAAEQAIAGKAIRDIRPGQYARAETKANKEALKRAPRDRAGAAEAQRAALLNNKLYSVARDAQNEVNSILKYVRKFDNRKLGKVIHHDYLEQIVDLLSPFEFKNLPLRQIDKNKSLSAWVEEQEANGFQPAIDVDTIEKSKLKHYKDMTLEELRGLKDTIKQVEHLGRYKDKLLTAKDRREFNERMLEAEDSIRENANRTVEERATPTDTLGKTGQWFRQMSAAHRKFSSIIREMDGGKDNGTMWNLLSRAMNEAGDMETEMRQQAAERVASLFKMIELDQGFMNLSAKKRLVPGTDISMTHEQRIMFAMNWGNEGNRQRLLDGGMTGRRALSMPQAQSILDTLTKPEWDFVQATWDYLGTYKEQIAALERKMTGVEPLWIEPASVETKFGTYPGGYLPAKYDAELSTRSESLEAVTDLRMGMKGAFGAAATRNGYTQERSKQVIGRPLLLSFNVIPQHVNEVIHRLSWQPWLTDANRVLRHLDSPIREHYGTEILREMRDTVMDIATGDAPAKNATEAAINRLRMGSTIVGMGWRVTTALLQPSGLAQSYVRVGPKWVSQGILQFLTSPNDSAEFADSRSTFMKNRGTTMNREINEVLNTLRTGEGVSNLTASYFWLIAKMQRTVDIPTWIGAYNKGLAEVGYENAVDEAQRKTMEDHAVRLADQAVIDSQSSGMTKDLARVQRGSPLNKILTNFYSYFSATYNLNIETVRKTNFMKPAEVMLMANNLIVLNVIPVLFAVALKESIKGNCGDDLECLAGKLANEQISYMLGQMILLREIGAAVGVATGGDQYGYQGPAGLRFFGDLYKAGVQVNQGEADMPMFKSLNNVAGAVLHYPAGQINNTVEGIIAIENGDVEGASILPALLFGPPKD